MSKYTTEVRYLCETYAGLTESVGFNGVNDILDRSWASVFDFDFPIFDEDYRSVLCKKILKHYYTREIGSETVGLWKLRLDSRMNEIMPYYNKLYETELIQFDPLNDVNVTTTHEKNAESGTVFTGNYSDNKEEASNDTARTTNSSTSESSASGSTDRTTSEKDKYSDTPQGSLQNVEDGTYLTNARVKDVTENVATTDMQNGSASGTVDFVADTNKSGTETRASNEDTKVNSTEDYITKVVGKSGAGSYSKMLQEYRETFLNIDKMVIDEFSDLFMGLW